MLWLSEKGEQIQQLLLSSNSEWVGRPDGELKKLVRAKGHVEGTGSGTRAGSHS